MNYLGMPYLKLCVDEDDRGLTRFRPGQVVEIHFRLRSPIKGQISGGRWSWSGIGSALSESYRKGGPRTWNQDSMYWEGSTSLQWDMPPADALYESLLLKKELASGKPAKRKSRSL